MKLNDLISAIVLDCVKATESIGVKLDPLIELEVAIQEDGSIAKLVSHTACRASLSVMVPRARPLATLTPSRSVMEVDHRPQSDQ
jgi:hypothetical protein